MADGSGARRMAAVGRVTVPVRVLVTVGSDRVDLEDWELFTVLRRKAGLTQAEVAAAAGVAQPNLSKWERGRRTPTDEWQARAWAALLGLSRERAEGAA